MRDTQPETAPSPRPPVPGVADAPHFRASFLGSVGFVAVLVSETLGNLPRLLRLAWVFRRRRARERRDGSVSEPQVVFVGDNMDAVHGISVSSHRMARDLTLLGTPTMLVGVSHSRNPPGERGDDGRVRMLPPACVQDLFGYEGQELAYPSVRAWCDLLRTRRVDVIEIETPGAFGLLALLSGLLLGIPVVHNYRTDLLAYTSLLLGDTLFVDGLHWFIRNFLRSGGRVIVPSLAFQEAAVGMGISRSRIHLLPRGVDLSRFRPLAATPRCWTDLGAPEGPVVVYLGRVSREKGLATLAEAFRRLLATRPDAVLGIVGEGPYRAELEATLRDTGRAIFAGEVTGQDLPRLLASSTIMAFPSTTDTFGNAVVESLACGVPAIVTDEGGPCEIVEDGRSGLVVQGHDPQALCAAMERLLSDHEFRATLGRQAIERARLYDPSAANEAHRQVYRAVHLGR